MTSIFEEMGETYTKVGDCYIPNITVPDTKKCNIGKYGRLHAKFIKENRPCFYSMKMLDGTWFEYLEETDTSARETVDKIIKELVIKRGITEELKARDQFAWVSAVQQIKHTAVKKSCEKLYQSVNPSFNYDEEFSKDSCYRDIPAVNGSLFTIARKLLIEAKKCNAIEVRF